MRNKVWPGLLAALLCCALLAGGGKKVELENGESLSSGETELSLVLTEQELSTLDQFPKLQKVDLSGSDCYAAILAWAQAHPQVEVVYTVPLPDGQVLDNSAAEADLSAMSDEQKMQAAEMLQWLPRLEKVTLGPVSDRAVLEQLQAGSGEGLNLDWTPMVQGRELDLNQSALDLSNASAREAAELVQWMPEMKQLQSIELGQGDGENSTIPWETIAAMEAAAPQAKVNYRFTLYGKDVDLHDTELDLNHIRIDDQGALVKAITACMPELTLLDMDFCGVDDEYMAQIRDALPNTNVVWRIWFGTGYTVRTDTERILASNPGIGGELTYANTRSLQYCTKVRYLDLGHNRQLDTIDFCAYMPDLEVLVAAMNRWRDASPLANCTKLEYAELQTGGLSDLRPLANLQNLRHLNIANDFALRDISPLYGLTNLERLFICIETPVSPVQVAEMQKRAPNCVINTEDMDPTRGEWRWIGEREDGYNIADPRYELLRQQMGYDEAPWSYAYIRNDPLYAPHGQGDNTTPPDWFNAQFQ